MGRGAIAGVTTQNFSQGAGRADACTHQQQGRPRSAWGLKPWRQPQGLVQVGIRLHLQALSRKAGECAEPLSTLPVSDRDRQELDPRLVQLGQSRHKSLGVLHGVEITELREQHHQPPAASPHARNFGDALQQRLGGFHALFQTHTALSIQYKAIAHIALGKPLDCNIHLIHRQMLHQGADVVANTEVHHCQETGR